MNESVGLSKCFVLLKWCEVFECSCNISVFSLLASLNELNLYLYEELVIDLEIG